MSLMGGCFVHFANLNCRNIIRRSSDVAHGGLFRQAGVRSSPWPSIPPWPLFFYRAVSPSRAGSSSCSMGLFRQNSVRRSPGGSRFRHEVVSLERQSLPREPVSPRPPSWSGNFPQPSGALVVPQKSRRTRRLVTLLCPPGLMRLSENRGAHEVIRESRDSWGYQRIEGLMGLSTSRRCRDNGL